MKEMQNLQTNSKSTKNEANEAALWGHHNKNKETTMHDTDSCYNLFK